MRPVKAGFYNSSKIYQPPPRQGARGKVVLASLNFYIIHTGALLSSHFQRPKRWPAWRLVASLHDFQPPNFLGGEQFSHDTQRLIPPWSYLLFS